MNISIQTERLVIRENHWGNMDALHRLLSGPEMAFVEDIATKDRAGSEENLKTSIEEAKKTPRDKYFLAIEERGTGAFVGQIGFTVLERYAESHVSELGYFLLQEFWGKGYASEAAKAVVEYAFKETGCHKMIIGCNAENKGSEGVMKKIGAKKEAHLVSHQFHDGHWCDRVTYRMLREE